MTLATVTVRGEIAAGPRHAELSCKGVGTLRLPWWPSDIESSGIAPVYAQQTRPGRSPLLLRESQSLPVQRLAFTLGTSPESSAEADVALLRKMATAKVPVTLTLGGQSRKDYRITELSIVETDWTSTGAVAVAEVDLTMTKVSDAVAPIGPVKGKKPRK
jgi:hypothetical protein